VPSPTADMWNLPYDGWFKCIQDDPDTTENNPLPPQEYILNPVNVIFIIRQNGERIAYDTRGARHRLVEGDYALVELDTSDSSVSH
jgi:hypothetical protein